MRSSSNAPCLKAQNTLGGSGDDFTDKLIPTRDGGFMVCGGTNSADGDFSVPATDGNDAYITKYNKFRHIEWTKTFNGTGDDFFNDIKYPQWLTPEDIGIVARMVCFIKN